MIISSTCQLFPFPIQMWTDTNTKQVQTSPPSFGLQSFCMHFINRKTSSSENFPENIKVSDVVDTLTIESSLPLFTRCLGRIMAYIDLTSAIQNIIQSMFEMNISIVVILYAHYVYGPWHVQRPSNLDHEFQPAI